MQKKTFRFGNSKVDIFPNSRFTNLKEIVDRQSAVILTDENVAAAHSNRFKNYNTIVLKAGEQYKVQATVDAVIEQLIEMEADRHTTLVGVGGGVITDLTGYIASVYMRGISFGFVPTSLLAMVDASIGGKNGIDVGEFKNMVGVIRQPSFILYDMSLLSSLPHLEWRNGFAEIIKHACIKDAAMFKELEKNNIGYYQRKKTALMQLVQKNALIKTRVVQKDEFETGERRLLNFGHTLGHALETQYELSHGEAIAIGMSYAANLSGGLLGFKNVGRVVSLIEKYELPTHARFNKDKVIRILKMDKKKSRDSIRFILLERIGKAAIQPISIDQLYESL
ncbi:MAG TPA: 3-dehydroquinate synthase [Flavisolibacter sp.]